MARCSTTAIGLCLSLLLFGAGCSERQTGGQEHHLPNDTGSPDAKPEPLADWPTELTSLSFGVTPFLDEPELRAAYQPLLDHLGSRLKVQTTLLIASSYSHLGDVLRNKEADLGQFTALSYVLAKKADPKLRIIAKQVADGAPNYLGYIYASDTSGIKRFEDLAGRSICFVDKHSTSGYLFPRAIARKRGFDPNKFFGKVEFGGHHLSCMERVLSGEVDASATYAGAFPIARSRGMEVHRIRILAKTQPIPYDAFAVRSDFPATAEKRLKQELLRLSTRSPAGKKVLSRTMRLNAWIEAHDEDYDPIREALEYSQKK